MNWYFKILPEGLFTPAVKVIELIPSVTVFVELLSKPPKMPSESIESKPATDQLPGVEVPGLVEATVSTS